MEDTEQYLKVLEVAQKICDYGPLIVEKLRVTEKKRLYALIVEAFRSFSAFSRLIRMHFLTQSSAVLRLFVEEVSKVVILVEHPELYDKFVEHCEAREKVLDMTQQQRKREVIKIFNLNEKQYDYALAYLDYGWIKSASEQGKYGYHTMLELAQVEGSSILKWIDNLDQFIHQNISSLSLTDEGFRISELEFIYLGCQMFEKLYVAFHNLTGKEYTINGEYLFEDRFWPEYEKILKPCDVKDYNTVA